MLEAAALDKAQEGKLEHEFGREYPIITRDERRGTIAKGLVAHFTGRCYRGKATLACIDRANTVSMYEWVPDPPGHRAGAAVSAWRPSPPAQAGSWNTAQRPTGAGASGGL